MSFRISWRTSALQPPPLLPPVAPSCGDAPPSGTEALVAVTPKAVTPPATATGRVGAPHAMPNKGGCARVGEEQFDAVGGARQILHPNVAPATAVAASPPLPSTPSCMALLESPAMIVRSQSIGDCPPTPFGGDSPNHQHRQQHLYGDACGDENGANYAEDEEEAPFVAASCSLAPSMAASHGANTFVVPATPLGPSTNATAGADVVASYQDAPPPTPARSNRAAPVLQPVPTTFTAAGGTPELASAKGTGASRGPPPPPKFRRGTFRDFSVAFSSASRNASPQHFEDGARHGPLHVGVLHSGLSAEALPRDTGEGKDSSADGSVSSEDGADENPDEVPLAEAEASRCGGLVGEANEAEETAVEEDEEAEEEESDDELPPPAAPIVHRPAANASLAALRRCRALRSEQYLPPPSPLRLCALAVHRGALGYAWLDRAHVLVCGQTAPSALWVGTAAGRGGGWGRGGHDSAGRSGRGGKGNGGRGGGRAGGGASSGNDSEQNAMPFFGLKRAAGGATTRGRGGRGNADRANDPTVEEADGQQQFGREKEAEGEEGAFRRPHVAPSLCASDSLMPKSIAADAHSDAVLAAAASVLAQVGRDAMPQWLFSAAFADGATAMPSSATNARGGRGASDDLVAADEGAFGTDDPFAALALRCLEGDVSGPHATSNGGGGGVPNNAIDTFGYAVCPDEPAMVHIVFPSGADANAPAFLSKALAAASAELAEAIGTLLDTRRAAIDALRRKRREGAGLAANARNNGANAASNNIRAAEPPSPEALEAARSLAVASFLPIFETHFTGRSAFTSTSAAASLRQLWPEVSPAGWAVRLDLSLEAMVLGLAGALHHVIGVNSVATANSGVGDGVGGLPNGGAADGAARHVTMAARVNAVAASLRHAEEQRRQDQQGEALSASANAAALPSVLSFLIADVAQHPGSGRFLHVDAGTLDSLQVFRTEAHPSAAVHNIGAAREGLSLYSLLARRAVGPLGKELLRQWLAMPTCDAATLSHRLDQVSFFAHIIANGGLQVPRGDAAQSHHPAAINGIGPSAAASASSASTTVDLIGQLNRLLRRVQHPDFIINRVRLQRHSAADYRALLLATTALLDVCRLLAPFAEVSDAVRRLVTQCQPDVARRLIERIATTIDIEQCGGGGSGKGRGGSSSEDVGGPKGGRGGPSSASHKNGGPPLSAADAPILRGVSLQLDQLRDCYSSIDFDAFLAAAATRELEQLPPYYTTGMGAHGGNGPWRISVAFMPHMGYLAVVDLRLVMAPSAAAATSRRQSNPHHGGEEEGEDNWEEEGRVLDPTEDAEVLGVDPTDGPQQPPTTNAPSRGPAGLRLPPGWEFVFRSQEQCFCRTALTRELDANIGDLHAAIKEERSTVLRALDEDVLALAHCLAAVRHVAEVDACLALAKVAVEEGWTRPTLTNNDPWRHSSERGADGGNGNGNASAPPQLQLFCADGIRIVGGFHPLLSRATSQPVIPFDLNLTHAYYPNPNNGDDGAAAADDAASTVGGVSTVRGGAQGRSWFSDANSPEAEAARRRGACSPYALRTRRQESAAGPSAPANSEEGVSCPPMEPNITNIDDDRRIVVLTGPHGSGKSVCQRAVALIAFMAHVGCFVPAARAEVPLFMDRIVCVDASTPSTLTVSAGDSDNKGGPSLALAAHRRREQQQQQAASETMHNNLNNSAARALSGSALRRAGGGQGGEGEDDDEDGVGGAEVAHALSSAFGRELAAVCRALHNATNNSLIIVDEFGKGTLAADGIAILAAVLGVLGDSIRQRQLAPYDRRWSPYQSAAAASPEAEEACRIALSRPPPIPTAPMAIFTTHYTEIFEEAMVSPATLAWKHMAVLVLADQDDGEGESTAEAQSVAVSGGGGGQLMRAAGGGSPLSLSHASAGAALAHLLSGGSSSGPSPSRSMLPSVYGGGASAYGATAAGRHHQLPPQSPADTGYGPLGGSPPHPHRPFSSNQHSLNPSPFAGFDGSPYPASDRLSAALSRMSTTYGRGNGYARGGNASVRARGVAASHRNPFASPFAFGAPLPRGGGYGGHNNGGASRPLFGAFSQHSAPSAVAFGGYGQPVNAGAVAVVPSAAARPYNQQKQSAAGERSVRSQHRSEAMVLREAGGGGGGYFSHEAAGHSLMAAGGELPSAFDGISASAIAAIGGVASPFSGGGEGASNASVCMSARAQHVAAAVFASSGRRLMSPVGMRYLPPPPEGRGGDAAATGDADHFIHDGMGCNALRPFRHIDPDLASPVGGYEAAVADGDDDAASPFPTGSPFSTIRKGRTGGRAGVAAAGALSPNDAASRFLYPSNSYSGGNGYGGGVRRAPSRVVCLFELETCTLDKLFRSALETARVAGVPPVILNRAAQILDAICTGGRDGIHAQATANGTAADSSRSEVEGGPLS